MRGRTLALFGAAALVAALGLPSALLPVTAWAGKWIDAPSTTPLTEPMGVGTTPAVAVNASGAEVVAWYEGSAIAARTRAPGGGAFSGPVTLTSPLASGHTIGGPSVAIDAASDILVAWTEYDGAGHYGVVLDSAPAGQPLGKGALIPGSVGATPRVGAQPLFLSDGTALVLWAGFEGPLELVKRPAGGEFDPAPVVVAANEVTGFAAAAESGTRALLAFTKVSVVTAGTETTTTYTLASADLSASGAVSGKQTIDTTTSVFRPECNETFSTCSFSSLSGVHVAADPAGDGLVSYMLADESRGIVSITSDTVKASYRVAGGGFEEAVGFPPVSSFIGSISQTAGMAPDGTALVVWEDAPFGSGALRYAQRSHAGAFPATGQVLALAPSASPSVAALSGEGAIVTYVHSGKEALAQEFLDAGPHGSAVALSAGNAGVLAPALDGDGNGDAVAAWEGNGSGGSYTVQAAAYDAGPRLSGLSVPASGVTGAPLPFGVTAFDPLSPVSATWTFGDGAQATGTSVTHAYAAAGAQTASVVATDAAGMSSTPLSGVTQVSLAPSITHIAAPPGPGPPPRATLKIPKQRLRDVLKHGLKVTVDCTAQCNLVLKLQVPAVIAKTLGLAARTGRAHRKLKPALVGQLSVSLNAAGAKTVQVKLTAGAKRKMRHARSVTLTVLEAAQGAGGPASVSQRVTLR